MEEGSGAPSPERKGSALSRIALGIAIFALILAGIPFATFGSGLFILAGLILSIVALAKDQAAKGASVTALIASLVAIPVTIGMSILSLGLIAAAASTTLDSTIIEENITSGISSQLGIDAKVMCPSVMAGSVGTVFQCEAVDVNGDSVIVDVTVTDNAGGVTWQVLS